MTDIRRKGGHFAVFGISAALLLALAPPATATAAAPGHAARLGPTQSVHFPARTKSPAPISASKRHELAASLQRINRHPPWTSTRSIAGSPSAAPASPHLVQTSPASSPGTQPPPTAWEFFRDTNLSQASVGGQTGDVDEPSVSNNGNVVLYTGNWYAAVSTDAGNSFTFTNPFSDFPASYRGFCCDQATIYDPSRNISIWSLLYVPEHAGDPHPGLNAIRLAVANGQTGVSGGSWRFWDVQANELGFTTSAPYAWLDYPQLALSSNYLYITANVFQGTASDPDCGNPADCTQLGSVVVRLSLSTLATLPQGQVLTGDSYSAACSSSFCLDTFTPVTQATSAMYFAADPGTASSSDPLHLRIFTWPENAAAPTSAINVAHSAFPYMASDGVCTDPGGHNACGRDDSRVRTGWLSQGLVSFLWDVKQGGTPPGAPGSNPYPYVQGVTVNPTTGMTLVDQPSFYSPTSAAVYVSVAANAAGNLGLTMTQAGGSFYPSVLTGIHDDVNAPNWTFNSVLAGTNGPNRPVWGDYFAARSDSGRGDTWLITGYAMLGPDTSVGNSPNTNIVPVFAWFGRARDDPFVASGLRCSPEAATPGGMLSNSTVATFSLRSGLTTDYSASVGWGDATPPTPGVVTSQGSVASVTAEHPYSSAGQYTMTVTVSDSIGSQAQCQTVVQVGYLFSVTSRAQYALPNSDGQTWDDMDRGVLSINLKPAANFDAVLSGNADLWTATPGYNQDLGISVVNTSALPCTGGCQPVAWKESGGFAGTFSPNAALVQTKFSMTAGTPYTIRLQWKTNKPTNNNGATIFAGAGPINGVYSPTRLTVELMPPAPAMTVQSQVSTAQYRLTGSNGNSWVDPVASAGTATPLTMSYTATQNGSLILSANADLWTANAGFNQDLGISVNGSIVAWKESGGFAGTLSPNAAFVQKVLPVTATTTYLIKLQWKANRADGGSIYAGAGPIAGAYSPTSLTAVFVPSGTTVADSAVTSQFQLFNSDGSTWRTLANPNPPVSPPWLSLTTTPANNCLALVSGNADLWTANAGFNQDLGIAVTGGSYPTTPLQPEAWKESGGNAGTFSPNAAFVQAVIPLQANITYTLTLVWKTNQVSGATIFAGAGGAPVFSESEITAQLAGC